ncbi:MAG TPA: NB-ARC domain-containing protein [Aldersonia sp.]
MTVPGARVPLVIAGAVGVGKTAFASRFAHELADDFPDGQLFADLGGAGTGVDRSYEVMTGFLAALGVAADRIPPDRNHRTGLYRSVLAQRRVIVVLDNVGGESQVRPLLARSTRSQILVTSRARLLGLDGVRRITMDVFARNASMDLIGAMIGADRLHADPEAGFKLAAVCEDLPLAISLAGRKIAAQPARPLSCIVAPLVGGRNSLRWLQVGDTSLADAFASAFRSLSALSLEVLHRLGRGGGKESSAGDVARSLRITVDAAELVLERLVDHGLVRRAPTTDRYAISTLVEQFSLQRTEELHRHVPSTSARRSEGDREDEFAMRRPASRMVARPRRVPSGLDEPVATTSVLEDPVIWIRRTA